MFFIIFVFTALLWGQNENDRIVLTNDSTFFCFVTDVNEIYVSIIRNDNENNLVLKNIKEIDTKDFGIIFNDKEQFTSDINDLSEKIFERTISRYNNGFIFGGGIRIASNKIQDHLGGKIGPYFLKLGFERKIPRSSFAVYLLTEFGLSGQFANSKQETFAFINYRIGAVWNSKPIGKKLLFFIRGGFLYLKGTIKDNADAADGTGFIPRVDFSDGKLNKSASAAGAYAACGLKYFVSNSIALSGFIEMGLVSLDFGTFKTNGLGPTFGIDMVYYF